MQKLIGFGDLRTSNVVARIADEEVAHVAVGVHWFVSICQKMDCAPCSTFKGLGSIVYSRVHMVKTTKSYLRHSKFSCGPFRITMQIY